MFRKLRADRKEIKKLTGRLIPYAMPGHNCLAGILFPAIYVAAEQIDDWDYEDKDTLTMYLGLLMKHNRVAAITFFYPTAG